MASSTVQSASTLASTIVTKIAGNMTLDTLNDSNDSESLFQLWLYGAGAVIFISVVGLAAIMAIPVIYNHHVGLIQLLIGLAIGTLTGDALLHLLPHALMDPHHKHPNMPTPSILTTTEHSVHDHHGHHHDHHDHHDHGSSGHNHEAPIAASIEAIDSHLDPHVRSVIYGLMALVGIVGLLVFERVLTIVSDFCSQNSKKSAKIASCTRSANDKLSNHNHTSEKVTPELEKLTEPVKVVDEKKDAVETTYHPTGNTNNDIQLTTEQCHRETIVYQHADPDRGFVVQLTDHHHHHHHQKQHQKGGKSFIMMIVTGDGMHNFFDGLAIGVAFAGSGIGGGLSTSVAILCHELPHEIGDFAVLLNAGLSTKRAVMYNTLSAVLCFIGMTVGIVVGKMDTGFLSAIIAGMFLYIALVNMVPQLDCCPTQSSTTRAFKLSIQLIGISIGVAIMCVISIYETKLQTLLQ